MNEKKTCPSCKGKGHIMDAAILLVPVIGWLIAWGERNDACGVTRDRCEQCKGRGYVTW